MVKRAAITASITGLSRRLAHYGDATLRQPVIVTKGGRPRYVLLSIEEYERLTKTDRRAFFAEDTPEELLADMEATARQARR